MKFWSLLFKTAQETSTLELLMYNLWNIWSNRNTCYHETKCATPYTLYTKSLAFLQEYQKLNIKETLPSTTSHSPLQWQPPPYGSLKLNVDARYKTQSREAKVAIVLRTHEGIVKYCGV